MITKLNIHDVGAIADKTCNNHSLEDMGHWQKGQVNVCF